MSNPFDDIVVLGKVSEETLGTGTPITYDEAGCSRTTNGPADRC